MQYFLTVPHDSDTEPTMETETANDPEGFAQLVEEVGRLNADLEASGALRFAGGLMPPSTAKTVDAAAGTTVDAPFVTADAYVGGFWVLETDTEAEALAWAERASRFLQSRIEVRALQ